MNLPQRISVKFFIDIDNSLDVPALVPVFHRWIQENSLPGLLIDVADYKHVPDGPALLLLGHEGDYVLDRTDGRTGFLYRGKREWPSANLKERLQVVWERAWQASQLLASEETLSGLSFRTNEVAIDFPDRLNVPNSPETFDALREDVAAALFELSGGQTWIVTHVNQEARRPFSLQATLAE